MSPNLNTKFTSPNYSHFPLNVARTVYQLDVNTETVGFQLNKFCTRLGRRHCSLEGVFYPVYQDASFTETKTQPCSVLYKPVAMFYVCKYLFKRRILFKKSQQVTLISSCSDASRLSCADNRDGAWKNVMEQSATKYCIYL